MPKKSTGYTPSGKSKTSPVEKESTPMKTASLPAPLSGGANKVESMPNNFRFPKLTKPAPMAIKPPKI